MVTATPPVAFDLALRLPSWTSSPSVVVTIDGIAMPAAPAGSYMHTSSRTWSSSKVSYELPMAIVAHKYTGASVIAPYTRYTYTVGPVQVSGYRARMRVKYP